MFFNAAEFPIVRLSYDQGAAPTGYDAFDTFESLLDRETPFVIIGQGAGDGDAEHEHDAAQRKKIALWSKKNKPRLRAFVKAMVYIEPSATKRLAMKAFQMVSEKFWGYPMLVVASDAEALDKARELLHGPSHKAPAGAAAVQDYGT
ncbi:hypothetical protein [Nitrospirillum pindoramense]|uniref:Uncharacterized protein n=1 Tax=Nitrospirillum amazonense TaxID=28077 RepID=A0A560H2V6_9PROT|nr:hypothetical protein [Nitrospirillum amazonense]TWB40642.1 hypothetical protein FBZ90_109245 [Nitrospirillum amazonense]